MAFDEGLAERIRAVLDARSDVDERRMFGGIAFLVAGNMACGVMGEDLLVRMAPTDAGGTRVRARRPALRHGRAGP